MNNFNEQLSKDIDKLFQMKMNDFSIFNNKIHELIKYCIDHYVTSVNFDDERFYEIMYNNEFNKYLNSFISPAYQIHIQLADSGPCGLKFVIQKL